MASDDGHKDNTLGGQELSPSSRSPVISRQQTLQELSAGPGLQHGRADPSGYGTLTSQSTQREYTSIQAPRSKAPQRDAEGSVSKPRKPSMPRRPSSRYQAPQRGQEFSVDDDPAEYESDVKSAAKTASGLGTLARKSSSTVRKRQINAPATGLARVDSLGEEEQEAEIAGSQSATLQRQSTAETIRPESRANPEAENDANIEADEDDEDEDDDDDISDAESFTLKDRQQAINQTHPFGIRIWKPALYKKNRSVEKNAEGDIHSAPGGRVDNWLFLFNLSWTLLFGWWLAILAILGALLCLFVGWDPGAREYGRVLWGLAGYVFYPFGKFVRLSQDEAYAEEDEGEGRSITEYEQWQSGDLEDGRLFFGPDSTRGIVGRRRGSLDSADEADSLLGHSRDGAQGTERDNKPKRRLFGRGQWSLGRVIFYAYFYFILAPFLLLVSGLCWFMVFWIPMGKVTALLFDHVRRHPLALSFHADIAYSRSPAKGSSAILVCTYRAVGLRYWKYTIDGTNIFLINLMGVVLFAIFDYWVLDVALGLDLWINHPGFVFCLSLFSIIPLAYFIGQAVASISAQSTMGVGAAINAFFSTVVEVFLYCVALNQGKGALVEGSIIGSIFAGILFLPGLSMCFGAIQRKTQRFNVKSAGVTSTMLLFAVIAAFSPTLFYQIYGSHELKCNVCTTSIESEPSTNSDCRRCFFTQTAAINDRFFVNAVRPYCWFAAVMLFLSYLVGLWFTLRTHAAVIWNNEPEEKRPHTNAPNGSIQHSQIAHKHHGASTAIGPRGSVKDSQLYQRILGQSLRQIGLKPAESVTEDPEGASRSAVRSPPQQDSPHIVPPRTGDGTDSMSNSMTESFSFIQGLSHDQSEQLSRQVAEVAATAATVAARDVSIGKVSRKAIAAHGASQESRRKSNSRPATVLDETEDLAVADAVGHSSGGHDAPNWSRLKSSIILLGATVLYAIIAEILVNTVDVVLESVDIDEKFLGITLFALVPNTTEFLNAISFAMNGNIALSMEIGSAYALQVCLLQIPALVLFSAVHGQFVDPSDLQDHTFNLLFPQWDMVTVILCVFLLSYVYGEGKSNYFKGSVLVMAYLVIVIGFYLSGLSLNMDESGIDRFEVMYPVSKQFKTVGRTRSGQAYAS